MTALAIYPNRYITNDKQPSRFFSDPLGMMISFVFFIIGAISGFFMADKETDYIDDDDFEYEDYLSEDEKAALEEAEAEDSTGGPDDEDPEKNKEDGGDKNDDPGENLDVDSKNVENNGSNKDGAGNKGDVSEGAKDENKGSDAGGITIAKGGLDPENNQEKIKPEEKPDLGQTTGKPGVDTGDVKPVLTYEEKIKDLDTRLDNGKIEFDDYKKELRAIEIEHTREIARQEVLRTQAEIQWNNDQTSFFKENPNFTRAKANPIVFGAFAGEVNRLNSDPAWFNRSGTDLLEEAKKNVLAAFGLPDQNKEKEVEPKKKEKTPGEVAVENAKKAESNKKAPKSLKDIPASDNNTDNPFEYLDKLEGADYERAISNLKADELEAYERSLS